MATALFFSLASLNQMRICRTRCRNTFKQVCVQLESRIDFLLSLTTQQSHPYKTLSDLKVAMDEFKKNSLNDPLSQNETDRIKQLIKIESKLEENLITLVAKLKKENDSSPGVNSETLEQLNELDAKADYAKQIYDDNALRFNIVCQKVPNLFFARILGFNSLETLEFEDSARKQPS
jgi:hypothetical protein